MKFHDDTRAILKAATLLALSRGAPEVDIDHLLECDPDLRTNVSYRDIPFSRDFLELLKEAADLTGLESSTILRPRHLELSLLTTLARIPHWGIGKPADSVISVLDNHFLESLKGKGVNITLLGKSLAGLTLRQCRPDATFFQTSQGQHFLQLSKKHTAHPLSLRAFLVLGMLLSRGPASVPLTRAGVSEEILMELLSEERHRLIVDFTSALGPGLDRLSPEARHTFHCAWRLRNGPLLESNDLLRGLVATLNPLENDLRLHQLLEPLIPQLSAHHQLPELPTPELSPEIYRIFDAALKEAGPDQPVSNPHLLIALAQCHNPLLTQHAITPEHIRWSLA